MPVCTDPRISAVGTTVVIEKMASLQSPRTQCCCCAVGVFAAMFGIFMLSAGICIVLNVTFMEVDTSGLPPNLHNESGKKVVGIILICVALACLGLSATVSIVYFIVCSKKSSAPTTSTNNSYQNQQNHHTGGASSGQDRPKSRESISSGKRRMEKPGALPRSDYKPKSHRGRKNAMHRSVLTPHQEEDLEAAKAAMELNVTNETYFYRRSSQGNILVLKGKEEEATGSTSALMASSSKTRTPIITVNSFHESNFTAARNDLTETKLNDSVSVLDEDSVSNACSEQYEEAASTGRFSLNSSLELNFTSISLVKSNELDMFKQKYEEDLDLLPPPELPHNVDVRTDISTSGTPPVSSSSSSLSNPQHNFLVVRPAIAAVLDNSEEKSDHLPDLPFTFGYQNSRNVPQTHTEQDIRSESMSSFNSTFSFDGDDPNQSEMEKLQKRMETLLESDLDDYDK